MNISNNYYTLLNIDQSASMEEIKESYRRIAKECHPDKNPDPQSVTYFKLVTNAYSILSNEEKRNEYDLFLKTSTNQKKAEKKEKNNKYDAESINMVSSIYNQLNIFLWDIEDFIQNLDPTQLAKEYKSRPFWLFLEKTLIFIDRWTFHPLPFDDYFLKIQSKTKIRFSNYFYDIRKRIDKYFAELTNEEITKKIDGLSKKKIDFIFEVFENTTYYLNNMKKLIAGEIDYFNDFKYENEMVIC